HCRGEPAAAYEGFASGTLVPVKRSFAISVARRRNASSTFCPLFADVRRYVQPKVLAISASSATPNCASAVRSALFATSTTGTLPATPSTASVLRDLILPDSFSELSPIADPYGAFPGSVIGSPDPERRQRVRI